MKAAATPGREERDSHGHQHVIACKQGCSGRSRELGICCPAAVSEPARGG